MFSKQQAFVQGLRLEMIRFLFSHHYDIYILVCGAEDQGHDGSTRNRLYIVLAHRKRTQRLHNPSDLYRRVCQAIRAVICTTPADYCIAPLLEIGQHANTLADSRGKRYRVARPYSARELCIQFVKGPP